MISIGSPARKDPVINESLFILFWQINWIHRHHYHKKIFDSALSTVKNMSFSYLHSPYNQST